MNDNNIKELGKLFVELITFEKNYYARIWDQIYKHFNAIWEDAQEEDEETLVERSFFLDNQKIPMSIPCSSLPALDFIQYRFRMYREVYKKKNIRELLVYLVLDVACSWNSFNAYATKSRSELKFKLFSEDDNYISIQCHNLHERIIYKQKVDEIQHKLRSETGNNKSPEEVLIQMALEYSVPHFRLMI